MVAPEPKPDGNIWFLTVWRIIDNMRSPDDRLTKFPLLASAIKLPNSFGVVLFVPCKSGSKLRIAVVVNPQLRKRSFSA